ncbi:MAG: N-acetyl sugar amidotransferase [Prevotella sp.]|nr:N-acetyl sugar amidotransferase [Candidatus Equicola faecalis]
MKRCNHCVMDTSDPDLKFDEKGICTRCNEFESRIVPMWNYGKGRENELNAMIQKIKRAGKGKEYDCIIGLSGGFDSSYMLHMAVREWGLRPLVLHVDSGWDLPVAQDNIKKLVDKLGVNLLVQKINWEQERNFQLALFKAGVAALDTPQDVAFSTYVGVYAKKYRIKYLLNGGNIATEVVTNPKAWCYGGNDVVFMKDILKKFGTVDMKGYPFLPSYTRKLFSKLFHIGPKCFKPLDYIPYSKDIATKLLVNEYGWEPYRQKHFESLMTKFIEGYWCPKRFGADIRIAQLSSLVVTGQMTREQALEELSHPSLSEEEGKEIFSQIAAKLEISEEELQSYFDMPLKGYDDYKNIKSVVDWIIKIKNLFEPSPLVQSK